MRPFQELIGLVPRSARFQIKVWLRMLVRRAWPIEPDDILEALRRLGIREGDVLLIHSSLDRLLGFTGEPLDLVDVFQTAVGSGGTLAMPTMPFGGAAFEYTNSGAVLDVRRTMSRMGLVTEVFRRSKGVTRSVHPTHPVALWGRMTEVMASGHVKAETGCGKGSPYQGLRDLDGKMLFLGVSPENMSFYHYLEERLDGTLPFPLLTSERFSLKVRDWAGKIQVTPTRLYTVPGNQRDFRALWRELRARNQWQETRVGRTRVIVLKARDVEAVVLELAERGIHCYHPGVAAAAARNQTLFQSKTS